MKKTWLSIVVGVLFLGLITLAGTNVINKSDSYLGAFSKMKCYYGLDCAQMNGARDVVVVKPSLGSGSTFASGDQTPAVDSGGPFFKSFSGSTVTITDFDGDGIYAGQVIVVQSQGDVTYDVTGSGIKCGSTDIVTSASGDITTFLYDGTDWRCSGFVDHGDNLN
jgi:hypothetical protein